MVDDEMKVFIGRKKTMNYVMAAIMNLESGNPCILMARGKSISRAVDVAEILKNKFAIGASYGDIKITTEELVNEDGSKTNVSSMEIEIKPAKRPTKKGKK
ncbi:MAG: DNA-binding protein Alba [Promethearchaeota archaeon]